MQLADSEVESPGPSIALAPSLAVDLSWVLHGASSAGLRRHHPALQRCYGERPDLEQRVRTFWDEEGYFDELLVLAGVGGTLEVDEPEELWAGLGATAARPTPSLALRSETGATRQTIIRRIERLRRSPKVRRAYLALLAEVWSVVGDEWAERGRPMAAARAADYRRQLDRGTGWAHLLDQDSGLAAAEIGTLLAEDAAGGTLTVVPCYFFGKALLLDLPAQVLLGVPAERGDEASRARTDDLARRLKTLADPTRLAILDALVAAPSSIGEMARRFELAQPTVSNHVKHLRETGVVRADRHGNRVELTVDRQAVRRLLDELSALVG